MDEAYNLEPIIEYSMTDEQALAYKIGLMWIESSQKVFPDCKTKTSYPKKGDPRNSTLFKYCYKLQKETRGLIDPKDYKLYVMAQLQMLKAVEIGNTHPLISTWCLIGDKAWVRWKIWKKKFDNIEKVKTLKEVGLDKVDFLTIQNELKQTKKLLDSKIKDEEQFKEMAKDIGCWISVGKVSGFYAALSPWVKRHCDMKEIDISHFCANITVEVENCFRDLFLREL
jgi:hypothetical protein